MHTMGVSPLCHILGLQTECMVTVLRPCGQGCRPPCACPCSGFGIFPIFNDVNYSASCWESTLQSPLALSVVYSLHHPHQLLCIIARTFSSCSHCVSTNLSQGPDRILFMSIFVSWCRSAFVRVYSVLLTRHNLFFSGHASLHEHVKVANDLHLKRSLVG